AADRPAARARRRLRRVLRWITRPHNGLDGRVRLHRKLRMFPEFSSAAYAPRPAHPGTVTFVEADGTERTEPADQIPDWLKFAPGADGAPVPVVRITRVPGTRGYNLRSFGADGKLLWVTLMVPSVPPVVTEPTKSAESPTPPPTLTPSGRWVWADRPTPSAARTEPTGWF